MVQKLGNSACDVHALDGARLRGGMAETTPTVLSQATDGLLLYEVITKVCEVRMRPSLKALSFR